ncbi:MAG: alpha/beta fold hydrolase [Bacteroidales bacterium]|nr:alpha/beta fold hydrolase [Bacteroidales bacterium]
MKVILRFLSISLFVISLASCSHTPFPKLEQIENKYNLSTEAFLMKPEHTHMIDSLYDLGVDGYFTGAGNVKIYYKYFIQDSVEKGAIVILAGRTEAAVKYKEVIFDLFNNGYSVYIHDHRGQGFSGRMLADTDMGYVDEFQYYVDDMKYFYDHFVLPHHHKNIFLLAHSMGGTIGVSFLEEYPDDFKAAAFSSPMLGFAFPNCLLIGFFTGDDPQYAMGHTNYDEGRVSFEENTLSGSEIRYERMKQIFEEFPEARLGGATYQWVYKSCKQFDIIFDNISNIETPLILFSAGDEEIVSSSAHNDFIEELNSLRKEVKAYLVVDAKHELLIEKDQFRIAVLTQILDFYAGYENENE